MACLLTSEAQTHVAAVPAGYAVSVSIPLSQAANGVAGELQLLQDARITLKLQESLWQTSQPDFDDVGQTDGFSKNDPARVAILRMVAEDGSVLVTKKLEHSLAKLETAHLYGDSRSSYLLAVDYTFSFGSYSGPMTSIWEVRFGRLHRLEATDGGKVGVISLMSSLKTTWKTVKTPEGRTEFLEAECRPTEKTFTTGSDFTITYARFYFDGVRWRCVERTVPGFAEFDEGFPARKNFP